MSSPIAAYLTTLGALAPAAEPAVATGEAGDLTATVLTGAWIPRLGGMSAFGPAAGEIDLALQFGLDAMEPSLNIELALARDDRWTLTVGAADFSTSRSGTFAGSGSFGGLSLADGDPFAASFDLTTVFGELAISTWRPFTSSQERVAELDNRTGDGEYIADLQIAPLVGFRYIDVDQSLFLPGGARADGGGEWTGVYLGLQVTLDCRPEGMEMLDHLRLQGGLGVGPALGGDGGSMWQVRAGLTMQVTENFGVMVGYRLLELDVDSDDYALDGGLQGLFLAGSLRF